MTPRLWVSSCTLVHTIQDHGLVGPMFGDKTRNFGGSCGQVDQVPGTLPSSTTSIDNKLVRWSQGDTIT